MTSYERKCELARIVSLLFALERLFDKIPKDLDAVEDRDAIRLYLIERKEQLR